LERVSSLRPESTCRGTEPDLVRAAQREPTEFAALYRLYLERVYRYLRARVRDDELAADLTQQVFVKALQSLPGYQERGLPFAAWLFRIARNQVVDEGRRRRDIVALDLLPELASAGGWDNPEQASLRREALDRLRTLVGELSLDERELLALRFAARLSSREIATVVGKREEAVKRRLTRLLRTLKDRYDET
jgi:RNA polymerase sigma-70 factor (ECF subfamily)